MNAAEIKDGVVVNVILVSSMDGWDGYVECPEGFGLGDLYANGEFSKPPQPEPEPQPVVIPSVVSMRQARLALLQQNLLATVDAAIAAGNEADKITWEYAT